ncbi:MAG: nickel pincer cofactor biosynthesis protein LarC [Chloroflexota bacterium]|nr:nickel pincer cofactor biosynthesis protein LarC [Chloroflexota bacterium]
MKSAYFNCIGGASGDMILGAVVDAGVPVSELSQKIEKLGISKFNLDARCESRGGVKGVSVSVQLHDCEEQKYNWRDFESIILAAPINKSISSKVLDIFNRLAESEAAAHRTNVNQITLHELGSMDTMIDVVGSVIGLQMLEIDRLYCSPLPSGSGVIQSDHGLLPTPAPAVANLIAKSGACMVPPPGDTFHAGEMVTPTGAAILTTLSTFRQPSLLLEKIGYGLGSKDSSDFPNVLGLWIGEEPDTAYSRNTTLIETNIDDMSAENLGYLQQKLFQLGASDVWFSPIQMKKNRPGTMISTIVPSNLEVRAVDLIIRESSTFGVRVRPLTRYEVAREVLSINTPIGVVDVKLKKLDGRNIDVIPEYESCRQIAIETGMPLKDVYQIVNRAIPESLTEL